MFDKPIDVNDGERKGNIEIWMGDIEKQMKKSLHTITKEAVETYQKTDRSKWVLKWPGQVCLAASQIWWTKEVEEAIADAQHGGLRAYRKKLKDQI